MYIRAQLFKTSLLTTSLILNNWPLALSTGYLPLDGLPKNNAVRITYYPDIILSCSLNKQICRICQLPEKELVLHIGELLKEALNTVQLPGGIRSKKVTSWGQLFKIYDVIS